MNHAYSVSQVNQYIKNLFLQDYALNAINVKGEVSNCKYHSSGHIYFTLKDKGGQIACVMFSGQRSGLSFQMKEGQGVTVLGSISIYERDGKYQLYAREILLDGAGDLYAQYEKLKESLKKEGLFDPQYKREIPAYPKKVGIVTAKTGAAVQDIINIASRRNPYTQLILYPATVQGEGAAQTIVKGIETLDEYGVDTIIIGRGGGSIEDLWAFNEEAVAWAIFQCGTPIISAVGHETDTTIADFAADLRAPTPSAAAELAVGDIGELLGRFQYYEGRLRSFMREKIKEYRFLTNQYRLRLQKGSPSYRIQQNRQYLMDTEERLQRFMQQKIQKKRHRLEVYLERMKGLSPLQKLNRGYAHLEKMDGKSITSIDDVAHSESIKAVLLDGEIIAEVIERTDRRITCQK